MRLHVRPNWFFGFFLSVLSVVFACGQLEQQHSELKADGWYGADRLSQRTIDAINWACGDAMGAQDSGVSYDECRLIVAGSAVRESSWDVDKGCESWGNQWDPACGLTQSRRSDANSVGLNCNPAEHSGFGYKCNALTGFRNLRCKADYGNGCDNWGQGRTLELGIKKHLGGNQGVFYSYKSDMQTVYERQDIRQRLGITGWVRSWNDLLYARQ